MRTLLIAIGNPLRADDGVAQAVIAQPVLAGADSLAVTQLTPEIAAEIAPYHRVVFLDADPRASAVVFETLDESACAAAALTHFSPPARVIALARALFGFAGQAILCRIPARDFSARQGLSRTAQAMAARAARELAMMGSGR